MDENKNNENNDKKGSFTSKIIGGVVVLVVILLIIFLGPKVKDDSSKNVDKDANATTTSDSMTANDGALKVVEPIVSGDYKYEFTGIKWDFDTTSPEVAGTNQTWLKMEFADFTRNGSAITFGSAYKLGVHPGTCKTVDFIDTASESGIPLAYAECSGDGVVRDFVVLQEDQNIVVKMNETKDSKESGWQDWYKIDVTQIVS